MLAAGPPPLEVCGGLLALTQDHKPIKLIAPFTAAVLRLKPTDAAKGAIEGETEGAVEGAVEGAEPCSPAERIDAWRLPLGWLICRCDDLEAAQLELLSALEPLVGADDTGPLPLKQAAPTLKALWECQASLTLPFPPTCHTPFCVYNTDNSAFRSRLRPWRTRATRRRRSPRAPRSARAIRRRSRRPTREWNASCGFAQLRASLSNEAAMAQTGFRHER